MDFDCYKRGSEISFFLKEISKEEKGKNLIKYNFFFVGVLIVDLIVAVARRG